MNYRKLIKLIPLISFGFMTIFLGKYISFGTILVITGIIFILSNVIYPRLKSAMAFKNKLKKYQADIDSDNYSKIERTILKIAKKNGGSISITELALEADISIDLARKNLEKLTREGMIEMHVNNEGLIIFNFPEFQKSFISSENKKLY